MKKILFLLLCGVYWCGVPLQAQSIKSLKAKLEAAAPGEERMIASFEVAEAQLSARDFSQAERYAKDAYQIATDINHTSMQTRAAYLLGRTYSRQRNGERNAKVWFKSALANAKKASDPDYIIRSVEQLSKLETKERDYRSAYNITKEAFDYFSQRGRSISDLDANYDNQKAKLKREKKALEQEKTALAAAIADLQRDQEKLYENARNLEKTNTNLHQERSRLEEEKTQIEGRVTEQEQQIALIEAKKRRAERKARQSTEIIESLQEQYLQDSVLIAQKDLELIEADLEKERNRLWFSILAGLSALLILMALSLYYRYRAKKRTAYELKTKNEVIAQERERSDDLLLNILPAPIAAELKEYGQAKAQKFEQATVLFTDFKNFTSIAEQLSPEQLVEELDNCFKAFDFIISQYNDIEKIKTIGDAYMCASGLTKQRNIPTNMIKAAQEMQAFLDEQKQEKQARGDLYFDARIGLHTGPVVAGVVGVNKFAYDIWGDTVNIAARMEAKCEPGRINVSETTYQLVRYQFPFQHRGKVPAKNKGMIDMYYVG